MAKNDIRIPVTILEIPFTDDKWHPMQVRPGVWQGRCIFVQDGSTFLDLDVATGGSNRKGTAMRYKSETECAVRCDKLNNPSEPVEYDSEDEE